MRDPNISNQWPSHLDSTLFADPDKLISGFLQHFGSKILVIENEPEVLSAITLRLTAAGYRPSAATNATEAMKLAVTLVPRVIILDIGLDGEDGHVLAAQFGRDLRTMMIPIIYLTGRANFRDRNRALNDHAFDYITKPYTAQRLLSSVKCAMDKT